MTFGFASSFVTYYVYGTVVSQSIALGPKYVGVFSALIDVAGALASAPAARAAKVLLLCKADYYNY